MISCLSFLLRLFYTTFRIQIVLKIIPVWQVFSIGTVVVYSAKYSALVAYKNGGTHADEYAQWRYTKTKTNPNPDPNRYRRCCPDPNARI